MSASQFVPRASGRRKRSDWPARRYKRSVPRFITYGALFNQELTESQCIDRSENVAFFATFLPRGASSAIVSACRSMRPATKLSFSGARCA
jgi:hypothetical protein